MVRASGIRVLGFRVIDVEFCNHNGKWTSDIPPQLGEVRAHFRWRAGFAYQCVAEEVAAELGFHCRNCQLFGDGQRGNGGRSLQRLNDNCAEFVGAGVRHHSAVVGAAGHHPGERQLAGKSFGRVL